MKKHKRWHQDYEKKYAELILPDKEYSIRERMEAHDKAIAFADEQEKKALQ